MAERSETPTVSSAPEPGPSPFERLCNDRCVTVMREKLGPDKYTCYVAIGELFHDESLTTDDGTPIDFTDALQLAASFLLARLENA